MLLEGSFLVDIVLLDERLQIQKSGNPLSFVRVSSSHQASMSWCNCSYWSEVSAGAHMGVYCHKTEVTSWTSTGNKHHDKFNENKSILCVYKQNIIINSNDQDISRPLIHLSATPKTFSKTGFPENPPFAHPKSLDATFGGQTLALEESSETLSWTPSARWAGNSGVIFLVDFAFFFLVGRGSLWTKNFRGD